MATQYRVPIVLQVRIEDEVEFRRAAFDAGAFDNDTNRASWFAEPQDEDENEGALQTTEAALCAAVSWFLDKASNDPEVVSHARANWYVRGHRFGLVEEAEEALD